LNNLKTFKKLGEEIFNPKYLRWANAISRQNCLHLKTKLPTFQMLLAQFHFEIALLSWEEQIQFITWYPNTLNFVLAVLHD